MADRQEEMEPGGCVLCLEEKREDHGEEQRKKAGARLIFDPGGKARSSDFSLSHKSHVDLHSILSGLLSPFSFP